MGNQDLTFNFGVNTVSGANTITHTGNRIENVLADAGATSVRTLAVNLPGDQIALTGTQLTQGSTTPVTYYGFNQMALLLAGGQVTVNGALELGQGLVVQTGTLQLNASIKAADISLDLSNPFIVHQPAPLSDGSGAPILVQADNLKILHDGGVGLADAPVFINVDVLEIVTRGSTANAAGVYVMEQDGLSIGSQFTFTAVTTGGSASATAAGSFNLAGDSIAVAAVSTGTDYNNLGIVTAKRSGHGDTWGCRRQLRDHCERSSGRQHDDRRSGGCDQCLGRLHRHGWRRHPRGAVGRDRNAWWRRLRPESGRESGGGQSRQYARDRGMGR